MSIATVRSAIGTALATISSIKEVHNQEPDAIGKLPVTIAQIESINYHLTTDGSITQMWRILLLLALRDSKAAHDDLDPYLAVSGSDSIKATLEAASIGDQATVDTAENLGHISYRNRTYVGVEFVVEVTDTA